MTLDPLMWTQGRPDRSSGTGRGDNVGVADPGSKAPTAQQMRRHWIPGASIGMVFLLFSASDILRSHHSTLWQMLGLVVVVLTGASYLFVTPAAMLWPIKKQLGLLVGLLALSSLAWPVAGSDLVGFWMFIGISAGAMLSMRNTTIVVGTLAVGMLLLSRIDHHSAPLEFAGTLIGLSLWMCAFMGNLKLTRELRQTRQELADAAVVAERERIGRDLHDILGHSLTAIAVKAGLARRLVERRADGAVQEIAEVERLAREALADVRATASGYREVSVGAEIAVAAMVLRAAGITPHVPLAVEEVAPGARELFGYVVREAVTNVVRHSGARSCAITLGADWVEIRDDGMGVDLSDPVIGGSGLSGLCQRVREAGGVLDVGSMPGGGFFVRATLAVVPEAAESRVPEAREAPAVPAVPVGAHDTLR